MADDQSVNPQDQTQTPEPPAPETEAKPKAKGGTGLEKELAKLEEERAELKRAPKDKLDGNRYAEVKTRIAEIKAELGIQ